MEEGQVSVDGVSRPLPRPFLVAATQNPVEYEGTYPLPEAQLDRFLLKVVLPLPDREDELEIAARHAPGFDPRDLPAPGSAPSPAPPTSPPGSRAVGRVQVVAEVAATSSTSRARPASRPRCASGSARAAPPPCCAPPAPGPG